MTEIATQQQTAQAVIAQIRSPEFREQLAAALPAGITPEHFARVATTALLDDQIRQRDPGKQLLACDRGSLFQALIKAAQDGLNPDGREAALVKRGDKAVYQPMVAGLRKIAAAHGWTIRSAAVREKDEFDYTDEPPSLYHKVYTGGPRGELCFAYAVARHADGRREQRVMTRGDVLKRAESATTKQVWDAWPDEMFAKTPARDLFQELPLAVDVRERLREALALAPGDAAEALYGSAPEDPVGADGKAATTEGSQPPAEATADPGDPPSAGAAGDDEPGPSEPKPGPFSPEPAASEDERAAINDAADAAASFVPPNGKYSAGGQFGPKTLQEILELGEDGGRWLAWALSRISEPPEYHAAIWAYSRVFAPGLHQEALARKEVQA